MNELAKMLRIWRGNKNAGRMPKIRRVAMNVPKTDEIVFRATRFAKRVVSFVRPMPRIVPLGVEQVLARSVGRELMELFIEFYYRSGTAPSMSYCGIGWLKKG